MLFLALVATVETPRVCLAAVATLRWDGYESSLLDNISSMPRFRSSR